MSAAHSIHLVTSVDDVPSISQLLYEAKTSLPINRLLWKHWPNTATQLQHYNIVIESSLKDESVDVFKVVDDTLGSIVGYLVMSHRQPAQPEPAPEKGAEELKPEIPEDFAPEVFEEVCAFAKECDTERDVEHIEVTHMFVKPQHRCRGIGRHLMKLAIEKTEKSGLPLSLGSEPAAHDFFLSNGFVYKTHVDVDLPRWAPKYSGFGVFRFSGMIYRPQ